MKDVLHLFHKIFVREFYRINAGFFMIIIVLAFGFMSGTEHKALAEYFVSGYTAALIPAAVWAIYAFKIFRFNRQAAQARENSILFNFKILPPSMQWTSSIVILLFQMLPAITYGLYVCVIAVLYNPKAIIILLAALAIITGSIALLLRHQILKVSFEMSVSSVDIFFAGKITRPFYQLLTESVLRRQPFISIGGKIFAFCILFCIFKLYEYEAFDHRLFTMGCILAFAGNIPMLQLMHQVEHSDLNWVKNIPTTLFNRAMQTLISLTILLLPDLIFVYRFYPSHLGPIDEVVLILSMILVMKAVYTFMFMISGENLMRAIFFAIVGTIVAILCYLPVLVLAGCSVLIIAWGYWRFYYRYEFIHE